MGSKLAVSGEFFDLPKLAELPDYGKGSEKAESTQTILASVTLPNRDFYRHSVVQVFQRKLLQPLRLVLRNVGMIGIRDIHIDLEIVCNDAEIYFMEPSSLIEASRTAGGYWSLVSPPSAPDIDRILTRSKLWLTSVEVATIQPKRSIESKLIGYFGVTQNAVISIKATIYGDCFPEPRRKELEIEFQAKKLEFTATDIVEHLQDEGQVKEP